MCMPRALMADCTSLADYWRFVFQVYRMSSDSIGCSLAEAAESIAYEQYLSEASKDGHPGLHVIYINTSLRTKALSHKAVPTITCTSSNVVNTVLQVNSLPTY